MSGQVFVTSDTHFGHVNLLGTPGRKGLFDSIEEHDEIIVHNWNTTVGKRDVVYHLGDVAWTRVAAASTLPRLRGIKYLVSGNHDVPQWMSHDWDKVYGAKVHDQCILTHIPIHPDELIRWHCNVHGHLHSKRIMKNSTMKLDGLYIDDAEQYDRRYICVSVEQTNFRPRPWDDVREEINQWRS